MGWLGYQWGTGVLRQRIQEAVSKQLDRRVYIKKVGIAFPIVVRLEGINVFEKTTSLISELRFLEIDRLSICPSLVSLIFGKLVLSHVQVDNVRLYLIRNSDGTLNCSDMLVPLEKGRRTETKDSGVMIESIDLADGKIVIRDNALAEPEGLQTVVDRLKLHVQQLHIPFLATTATRLSLSSRIGLGKEESATFSSVSLKGWINWLRRDLEAKIEIQDLDFVKLKPYLRESSFFASLQSCRVQFSSEAKATENILTAQCRFKLSNVVVKPGGGILEGKLFGVSSSTIWHWLEQSGKGANVEIIAKGNLYPFKIKSVNFSTDFIKNALASSVTFKVQQVVQQGKEIVKEGGEALSKRVEKTGIGKIVEKASKTTQETKDSIKELLP